MVEDMDWILLVDVKDQWRALVNTNEPSCSINGRDFIG
jgi:hypothetical protein